jgi:hypothetical protein
MAVAVKPPPHASLCEILAASFRSFFGVLILGFSGTDVLGSVELQDDGMMDQAVDGSQFEVGMKRA